MAIQGSLKTLSFPELLSLLQQLRKSGVLRLISELEERGLLIQGGNIVYATSQGPTRRIGTFLVQMGLVTEEEIRRVAEDPEGGDEYFGERLVDSGLVQPDDLRRAVKRQILDIVEEIMTWTDGAFYFDENELPFAVPLGTPVSTQSILLEATHRADERRRVSEFFPDLRVVLAPRKGKREPPADAATLAILEQVDGQQTVDSILFRSNGEAHKVAETLHDLLRQGLISPVAVSRGDPASPPEPDLRRLPVSPEIPGKLFRAFNQESGQLESICDVISEDPLLAAKVVRTVMRRADESVRSSLSFSQMVNSLGTFELRSVLIPEALRGIFFPSSQFHWNDWWIHSRTVARLSKAVAVTIGYASPEEAYVAGLLHNLGAFILMSSDPEKYRSVVGDSQRQQKDLQDIEETAFGVPHTKVGAVFAEKWGFPRSVLPVIRYHHRLETDIHNTLLSIVVSADGIARTAGIQVESQPTWEGQFETALGNIQLPRRKAVALLSQFARAGAARPSRAKSYSY